MPPRGLGSRQRTQPKPWPSSQAKRAFKLDPIPGRLQPAGGVGGSHGCWCCWWCCCMRRGLGRRRGRLLGKVRMHEAERPHQKQRLLAAPPGQQFVEQARRAEGLHRVWTWAEQNIQLGRVTECEGTGRATQQDACMQQLAAGSSNNSDGWVQNAVVGVEPRWRADCPPKAAHARECMCVHPQNPVHPGPRRLAPTNPAPQQQGTASARTCTSAAHCWRVSAVSVRSCSARPFCCRRSASAMLPGRHQDAEEEGRGLWRSLSFDP